MRTLIQNPESKIQNSPALLPKELRPIFWEYDFSKLRWPRDRELVIARVLESGSWEHIQWLRGRIGDRLLRAWIIRRRGRGLSSRDLRFWELLLHLPRRSVKRWLKAQALRIWEGRFHE